MVAEEGWLEMENRTTSHRGLQGSWTEVGLRVGQEDDADVRRVMEIIVRNDFGEQAGSAGCWLSMG